MTDRDFTRQSFLGTNSEQILAEVRVVICGLGGGGSHIAQQLAHLGVGHYRLIDPDIIEASNLNRLVGGTQADVDAGTAKVDIAKRMIKAIRPWADVEVGQCAWQEADHLMRDAHVVFGCLDGYQQRDFLEGAARRYLQPYIDIGMDVTQLTDGSFAIAGQMITTFPDGPCMRCLGFLTTARLSAEENEYGDVGINPQVVWTNGTLASLAVGSFVSLITPWSPSRAAYRWLELDGNQQSVTPSRQPNYMPQHERCPHHGGPDGLGDPFFSLRAAIA
jgi:molybdopterin-synthase adenylyltransferase